MNCIHLEVTFPEDIYYKIAGRQNGATFDQSVNQLVAIGIATLERDEADRLRLMAGSTQIDMAAMSQVAARR